MLYLQVPFIKLFRTPRSSYFLDINKDEIVPISDESYYYLENVLGAKGLQSSSCNKIDELIALEDEGYLQSESVVKEIGHPCVQMMPMILERNLCNLILQVTQDCNFRCSYCTYSGAGGLHQRTHAKKAMSWETAKKAVDFLWSRSVDSTNITISFYGGEPLLEFELIKKVVEYSKKMFSGKKLIFAMTSNGTLLDEEKIRYLDDMKFALMLSLDGTKDINDKYRMFVNGKGTYDAIMQSVERIRKFAPEMIGRMRINMVLMPESDYDLISKVRQGNAALDDVTIMSTAVDFGDELPKFSDDFIEKAEYHLFLALLAHYGRTSSEEVSPIAAITVENVLKDLLKYDKLSGLQQKDVPSGTCLPGQSRLFVDVDGNLLPCERVNENSSAMKVGTLDEGFYIDKVIQLLEVGGLTKDTCIGCWCFRYCDLCAKRADDGSENLSAKQKLMFCSGVRSQAEDKLRYYLLLKEIPILYRKQIRHAQRIEGENI